MNIAIILAGGTGVRLGGCLPKQYIEVCGKPVLLYCLEKFERHARIDKIIIVAAEEWQAVISGWVERTGVGKFSGFAPAGSSRQHSIVNGLRKAQQLGAAEQDAVIIHDAARPNVSQQQISQCLDSLCDYDGAMPVLPVKDTVYLSENGEQITSLLNRDALYAGQAPEAFRFGRYLAIHTGMTETELALVRGSSEIAYRKGFKIRLFPGDEHNYKITTAEDLDKFIREAGGTEK